MLRLSETNDTVRIVDDQKGTPTSALDIADAVISVAKQLHSKADSNLRGVFHMTGQGEATWADFGEQIFDHLKHRTGKSVAVNRITTDEYPTPAQRPKNSRLSCLKLADTYNLTLPSWEKSTSEILERLFT